MYGIFFNLLSQKTVSVRGETAMWKKGVRSG
jgi:hypothetical protein